MFNILTTLKKVMIDSKAYYYYINTSLKYFIKSDYYIPERQPKSKGNAKKTQNNLRRMRTSISTLNVHMSDVEMNRGFHIENFMGLQLQRGLIGSTEHPSGQTRGGSRI